MPVPDPILTVDVEEWFHVCGNARYGDPSTWEARPERLAVGLDRLLGTLARFDAKATFFVLGWVARRHPQLVKRIRSAGHEVGSHGDMHRRVFEMPPAEFRRDLRASRDALQELLGEPVTMFRAPEWSMRRPDSPALAILVEEGFRLDSSLVPAPPVGLASNPRGPVVLETASGPILEVPPLMGTFFFRPAILGGGVCSRMTRFSRLLGFVEKARAAGIPPVLYLHPWELDPEHPAMRLSLVGSLVHFAGRRRTAPRLERLLSLYRFALLGSAHAFAARDAEAAGVAA